MAALTIQQLSTAGAALTFAAAAAGGDTALVGGSKVMLLLLNDHGSASRTITIPAVQTTRPADGIYPAQAVANIEITLAAGAYRMIGPIPRAYLSTAGLVSLTYSDSGANIKVAAVRF